MWSCSASMFKKTVLITGASRGIGAETARLFAQRGWTVGIHCHRSRDRAETLLEELRAAGAQGAVYQADAASREEVREMVRQFIEDFGTPEALVCSAGIARQELFSDITPESWREILGVDLDGVFHCCQAVLPGMLQKKRGRIITLSSMWGQVGASCEVAYSAAKAGVIGLTKALAKEVAPSGITVNCVAPGVVDTDMVRPLGEETLAALAEETPLGRLGTAEDVAGCVSFLCSPGGAFLTGQVIAPNGGLVI